MKIGLAIAPENALPSAFVVFRDVLETSMAKASRLGYQGVELALLDAGQVEVARLERALHAYHLELPAISTGQVFSEARLWFTHPDEHIRRQAVARLQGLIDLAARFGAFVNVGRVRGFIHEGETRHIAEERFMDCMARCADYAQPRGVSLLLEPVNRYEINYLNNVPETLETLQRLGRPNVKLMPDVFHMNIEDASISGSLELAGNAVGYVHFADSNRWSPGQGHLDFRELVATLRRIGYDGYVTCEILPYPDPDTAAARAIAHLNPILQEA